MNSQLLYINLFSMRFLQSLKSLGFLLLGATFALGAFPDFWVLLLPYLILTFLWGSLYLMNDFTDYKLDKLNKNRKRYLSTLNKKQRYKSFKFATMILVAMLIFSLLINFYFFLFCLIMVIFQFLYIFKPFRFKEKPILDMVPVSVVNPICRFYAGWSLISLNFDFVWFVAFLVLYSVTTNFANRFGNRSAEDKMGCKGTTLLFSYKQGVAVVIGLIALLVIVFIYLCFSYLNPGMLLVFLFLFIYYCLRKLVDLLDLSKARKTSVLKIFGYFMFFFSCLTISLLF